MVQLLKTKTRTGFPALCDILQVPMDAGSEKYCARNVPVRMMTELGHLGRLGHFVNQDL